MTIRDLVYGRLEEVDSSGLKRARPAIVDMDTVRDFVDRAAARLRELDGPNPPYIEAAFAVNDVAVGRESLDSLSITDRNRLHVEVFRPMVLGFTVDFQRRARPDVRTLMISIPRPEHEEIRAQLQRVLQDGNPPVFRPRRLFPVIPIAFAGLSAVLWLWVLFSVPLPIAVAALGWVLLVGLSGACWSSALRLRRFGRDSVVGNRIIGETREMTIARRADARANLKISLITLPVGLVAGILLALVTHLFGLK